MAATGSCPEVKLPVSKEDERTGTKIIQRAQWLRAAILGANDGLLSTTSLMLGIGAAKEDQRLMVISGLAGALAGACSMTVGEFVSVSTQRDIEKKTKEIPESKFCAKHDVSHDVKVQISGEYVSAECTPRMKQHSSLVSPHPRSPLSKVLAGDAMVDQMQVQEVNLADSNEDALPNPFKAATASGLSFLCGSLVPILTAMAFPDQNVRVAAIVVLTTLALAVFGGVGARLGGSSVRASAVRVLIGGWISMAVTYGLLKPFDADDHKHGPDTD